MAGRRLREIGSTSDGNAPAAAAAEARWPANTPAAGRTRAIHVSRMSAAPLITASFACGEILIRPARLFDLTSRTPRGTTPLLTREVQHEPSTACRDWGAGARDRRRGPAPDGRRRDTRSTRNGRPGTENRMGRSGSAGHLDRPVSDTASKTVAVREQGNVHGRRTRRTRRAA